jgi:predicted DNA-binding transcriptional regulator AlpA
MAREAKEWLTKAQVMAELGCARSTLELWCSTGRAPTMRQLPNKEWRCARSDLDAWLDALVRS